MKLKKCESGFAQNWFCENGSVQNWSCKCFFAKLVLCENCSMIRQLNENSKVRKWFCAKLVLLEIAFAKLILHIIGATKVVLCKKGSVGNWFNDSTDE